MTERVRNHNFGYLSLSYDPQVDVSDVSGVWLTLVTSDCDDWWLWWLGTGELQTKARISRDRSALQTTLQVPQLTVQCESTPHKTSPFCWGKFTNPTFTLFMVSESFAKRSPSVKASFQTPLLHTFSAKTNLTRCKRTAHKTSPSVIASLKPHFYIIQWKLISYKTALLLKLRFYIVQCKGTSHGT